MNKEKVINTVSEEQTLHNELNFEINQELIHLMKRIVELQRYNNNLQQRIDKAIEYIEENIGKDENGCGVWWYSLPDYTTPDELLSILKGENND